MTVSHTRVVGVGSAKRRLTGAATPRDLVVILPLRKWTCAGCGAGNGFMRVEDRGPLCLACADMDHLVFLPSGDTALSRRAKAASGLWAVVVRFSRSRRRYERQGLLVEEAALEKAEAACLESRRAFKSRKGGLRLQSVLPCEGRHSIRLVSDEIVERREGLVSGALVFRGTRVPVAVSVLLDEVVPTTLVRHLVGAEAVRDRGWSGRRNSDLLIAAEAPVSVSS